MNKKLSLSLSECEAKTLLQLSINHPWRDARTRAAGLLCLHAGEHPRAIGNKLNVSHQSIYNWREAWESKGLVGLLGGHVGGRPLALPESMIATAVSVAKQGALSVRGITQRVEAAHQCDLPCTQETLRKMLKRHGLSFKRTRMSLKKPGPGEICRLQGRIGRSEELGP
jgi:transposase